MVLTGVGLKLDVWLGVVFTKSNLVVVSRGRVLNYTIHGRFYAVFTSTRCNDVFKNAVGFVAKHVIICTGPLTFLDPKCGALVFAKPPMDSWMKWIASSLLTISLNPSFFLTYVLPIESKISTCATPTPQKIIRVSQQKNDAPRFENNISFIFIRSIQLDVSTWIQVDLRGLSSTLLLDSALGRLKHRGTKKRTAKCQRERKRVNVYIFFFE